MLDNLFRLTFNKEALLEILEEEFENIWKNICELKVNVDDERNEYLKKSDFEKYKQENYNELSDSKKNLYERLRTLEVVHKIDNDNLTIDKVFEVVSELEGRMIELEEALKCCQKCQKT